jgi:hypothetical protein
MRRFGVAFGSPRGSSPALFEVGWIVKDFAEADGFVAVALEV